jgi:hypothetical protein
MSRLSRYRPSPAMIVALLALFISMGGTGYAVTKLPKRSVGPAQLRKNAVRSEHIRAGSITAAKLAKSTLTSLRSPVAGPSVGSVDAAASPSASTPDRVPYADRAGVAEKATLAERAAQADRAASADTAAVADSAKQAQDAARLGGRTAAEFLNSDTIRWIPMFSMGPGTRDIVKAGPMTLTARCQVDVTFDGMPNQDVADIIISTIQPRSAFDGDDLLGSLDPGDNIDHRQFTSTYGPTGVPRFEASSDGLAMGGDGVLYIKGSYLTAGVNVMGQPGKCRYGGYVFL